MKLNEKKTPKQLKSNQYINYESKSITIKRNRFILHKLLIIFEEYEQDDGDHTAKKIDAIREKTIKTISVKVLVAGAHHYVFTSIISFIEFELFPNLIYVFVYRRGSVTFIKTVSHIEIDNDFFREK